MKKKAISPLIATVLLIGFTVSLTVLVMTWGKSFITEKATKEGALAEARIDCTNIDFTIDKSCKKGSDFNFTIRSLQSTKIDGFTFRSTELANTIERYTALESFATIEINDISIAKSLDTIDIVPLIKSQDKYLPCSAQAKTVRISACNS